MISTLTGSTELCDTEGASKYPLAQNTLQDTTRHTIKNKQVPMCSSKVRAGGRNKARKVCQRRARAASSALVASSHTRKKRRASEVKRDRYLGCIACMHSRTLLSLQYTAVAALRPSTSAAMRARACVCADAFVM